MVVVVVVVVVGNCCSVLHPTSFSRRLLVGVGVARVVRVG